MRKLLLCVGFAAALAACGDNDIHGDDTPGPDANVFPDAAVEPDAMVCPARAMGMPGGPCMFDDQCDRDGVDGTCYVGGINAVVFPPEGYCYLDDNLSGNHCANDGECGTDEICVDFPDFTPYRVCMPACACEGNTCPANQACFDSFNGYGMDRAACVPGNSDANDGDACDGFYECDEFTTCFGDSNDFEFPGGQCSRYGCTLGDDSTCDGGTCINVDPPFTGTTCADTCTGDNDCRTAEGYVCYDPDGVGTAANYCRHPHVGDACATAADCGGGTWICKTTGHTGGYCTQESCDMPGQSADDCTPGSACYDPLIGLDENYCVDRCADADIGTQGTCRTGYTCQDVLVDIPDTEQTGGCVPN